MITWNTNISVPLKIELIRDNQSIAVIKETVPAQQSGFLWKVPVTVSPDTGYTLRITPLDATLDTLIQTSSYAIEVRGIPSTVQDNSTILTIGPNPTSSALYVGGSTQIQALMLFSNDGSLVVSQSVQGTGDVVDVSNFPQGSYILRCETATGPVHRTVVIRR